MGENFIITFFLMSDTVHKNSKSNKAINRIGMFIADKDNMANHRNSQSQLWDGHHATIFTFIRSMFRSILFKHTTPHKNDMYEIPIFVKISIGLIAWWETFVVQNIYVQWIVTIYVLAGGGMWLYSRWLSIEKKNLIFTNISTKETKRWMKIARNINLQHDIDSIVIRCFIIVAIGITLFIITTN